MYGAGRVKGTRHIAEILLMEPATVTARYRDTQAKVYGGTRDVIINKCINMSLDKFCNLGPRKKAENKFDSSSI